MSQIRSQSRRPVPFMLAAVVALVAVLGTGVEPAAAHGDEGDMTVVRAEETRPLTVALEVGLVHADDGHLAEEAEVWVDASTEGTALEPVGFERASEDSAVYAAEVVVPVAGEWTFEINSTEPAATATATVQVADVPVAQEPDAGPTTTAVLEAQGEVDGSAQTADDQADDDGDISVVLVVLAVLALIVVALAGYAAVRRRNSDRA